jgi:outer membrane lipoprotein LolB
MWRLLGGMLLSVSLLAACATPRVPLSKLPWDQRVARLQGVGVWHLDGRVAAAIGTQGWQASLSWEQTPDTSVLHLAGPLGVGAQLLKLTPTGLYVNGAPAGDAVLAQLQDRVGFELPLAQLRYWLLGVPQPGSPFTVTRDDRDCAQQLSQAGWVIGYDRYMQSAANLLPQHLVLTRDTVRVRIVVDHWVLVR